MITVSDKFVYLMRAGETHYKVGIAQDVLRRIKEIQTGNPLAIELIVAIHVSEAQDIERGLHKWLSEYKSGGGSEWFQLTSEQAIVLVARLTSLTITADISQYIAVRNLIVRQTLLEKQVAAFLEDQKPKPIVETLETLTAPVIDREHDELFDEAVLAITKADRASTSMLQRDLRIGYARSSRLMGELERAGIVGPQEGARARELL